MDFIRTIFRSMLFCAAWLLAACTATTDEYDHDRMIASTASSADLLSCFKPCITSPQDCFSICSAAILSTAQDCYADKDWPCLWQTYKTLADAGAAAGLSQAASNLETFLTCDGQSLNYNTVPYRWDHSLQGRSPITIDPAVFYNDPGYAACQQQLYQAVTEDIRNHYRDLFEHALYHQADYPRDTHSNDLLIEYPAAGKSDTYPGVQDITLLIGQRLINESDRFRHVISCPVYAKDGYYAIGTYLLSMVGTLHYRVANDGRLGQVMLSDIEMVAQDVYQWRYGQTAGGPVDHVRLFQDEWGDALDTHTSACEYPIAVRWEDPSVTLYPCADLQDCN